jgi:hypothetical protein
VAIEKLKRHKSPGIDQIQAEFIKQGEEQFFLSSIKLFILLRIRRNFLRSRSLYLSIRRAMKEIVVIIEAYQFVNYSYIQNFIQHPAVQFNSICRGSYWGT